MGSNTNALCSYLSLIHQKGKRVIMKDQQRMNNAVHLIAVSDINYPKENRLLIYLSENDPNIHELITGKIKCGISLQ